jgi:site-specific DNA-adenine methylase
MASVQEFQMPLFGGLDANRIINVASVPQRSPFRYPGGKTWLVPFIRQWLTSMPQCPAEFIEPFAGGAIIGLTVAFEKLADHVTLVEIDEEVASVWKTIIYGWQIGLSNSTLLSKTPPMFFLHMQVRKKKKPSKQSLRTASIGEVFWLMEQAR